MIDPRTTQQLFRELKRLDRKSLKWAERRWNLPPGSSRARVTTANAEWARAAEARDRVLNLLESRGEGKGA